ncbi:MAG: hypothetical protein JWR86_1734 [Enterovirga sp.]|jgi:hypothetical protein|nr:hypothetical protein [Enterovirga sp.]
MSGGNASAWVRLFRPRMESAVADNRHQDGTSSGPDSQGDAAKGRPQADLAAARAPGERRPGEDLKARQEQLLDEAVEETFPASDPISPKRITK